MSQMIIKIIDVDQQSAKSKTGKPYDFLEVSFKNMTFQEKAETKKIFPFGSKEVFDTLKRASKGQVYSVLREKDDAGYWQWIGIQEGEVQMETTSKGEPAKAGGGVATKSTFETPEERANAISTALADLDNLDDTPLVRSMFALRNRLAKMAEAEVQSRTPAAPAPVAKKRASKPKAEVDETPAAQPTSNLVSENESARLDALTEVNRARLDKASPAQVSQVIIEAGFRPATFNQADHQADLLTRVHPDDLKTALDNAKVPQTPQASEPPQPSGEVGQRDVDYKEMLKTLRKGDRIADSEGRMTAPVEKVEVVHTRANSNKVYGIWFQDGSGPFPLRDYSPELEEGGQIVRARDTGKPEQMNPAEWKDAKKKIDPLVFSPASAEFEHKGNVARAFKDKLPVSAEAVDTYGLKLPDGYVEDG